MNEDIFFAITMKSPTDYMFCYKLIETSGLSTGRLQYFNAGKSSASCYRHVWTWVKQQTSHNFVKYGIIKAYKT